MFDRIIANAKKLNLPRYNIGINWVDIYDIEQRLLIYNLNDKQLSDRLDDEIIKLQNSYAEEMLLSKKCYDSKNEISNKINSNHNELDNLNDKKSNFNDELLDINNLIDNYEEQIKSREDALKSREDEVKSREDGIKSREDADLERKEFERKELERKELEKKELEKKERKKQKRERQKINKKNKNINKEENLDDILKEVENEINNKSKKQIQIQNDNNNKRLKKKLEKKNRGEMDIIENTQQRINEKDDDSLKNTQEYHYHLKEQVISIEHYDDGFKNALFNLIIKNKEKIEKIRIISKCEKLYFDETNNFFRLLVKRGIDEYKKIASASTLISNMVFKLREKIEQGKLFFNKTIYNNQKSII